MSHERLGVECQLTGWCKMHVPWTCLEPAPHVALCAPRGWSPLPLRACAGRVVGLGAPGWEGVELSAGNRGADSLGPLIATPFHAQLLHLPWPRAASGAPRRRCQTHSAPPAGQGGAHTGLPHSQLIVHSRQLTIDRSFQAAQGAGEEAAWTARGLALSLVSFPPRDGTAPAGLAQSPLLPGG